MGMGGVTGKSDNKLGMALAIVWRRQSLAGGAFTELCKVSTFLHAGRQAWLSEHETHQACSLFCLLD